MANGERVQREIGRWRGLIAGVERDAASAAFGQLDERAAGHVREASQLANAALDDLALGAADPPAQIPPRPSGNSAAMPDRARRAKWGRDALLRLGVCAQLGRWKDAPGSRPGLHLQGLSGLLVALSQCRAEVPPGLAPTPGYLASGAALSFFGAGLRRALARLSRRYQSTGADFDGLWQSGMPLNQTLLSARRLSRVWTLVACAVYVDWLLRRVDGGSVDDARCDLWRYSTKDFPVQFRAPDGMAVLPTADDHMHLDLWTQWVVGQSLQASPALDADLAVDEQWHALRLHMHDFSGKSSYQRDGNGRLHSGLAIGMVYQALVVDHLEFIAVPNAVAASARCGGQAANQETIMPRINDLQAVDALPVPLPPCCAGQRLTMRVVWEWQADKGPAADGAGHRLAPELGPPEAGDALEAAWRGWRDRQWQQRAQRDREAAIVTLAGPALRFAQAPAGCLLADSQLVALGHLDLSPLLGTGPLWIDLCAVAWLRGGWLDLRLQLVEAFVDGQGRDWLAVDVDVWAQLARDGLDWTALLGALVDPGRSLWAWRHDGVGVFLTLGVDPAKR